MQSLPAVAARFYELLAGGNPSTTLCGRCVKRHYPPHERCPRCGSETQWVPLAPEGSLYAFTQQDVGLRFTKPDVVGLVQLDDGVRVFGVIEASFEELRVGQRLELTTKRIDDDAILAFVPVG